MSIVVAASWRTGATGFRPRQKFDELIADDLDNLLHRSQ